jgi:arylsulfate sulfotransferase
MSERNFWFLIVILGVLCIPAHATVQIVSLTPSLTSPQPIGTPITWTATATDTNPGPLTFQFNVAAPRQNLVTVRDFNAGVPNAGTWTSNPFVWVPTGVEGTYQIELIIKDFASGETASSTVTFSVSALVTGSTPVVVPTTNALVALFSSPSCAQGSTMRVAFQQKSKKTPASYTNWVKCHPGSMNFEIAGMYANASYYMEAQTNTAGKISNGTAATFTTGQFPSNLPVPVFQLMVPGGPDTDSTDSVLLHSLTALGAQSPYPSVATDLVGHITWYYYDSSHPSSMITRSLTGGDMLMIQDGYAWTPATTHGQFLREIDLAGNIVKETNTGIIQQQLLAMGATDAGPCNIFPSPPPVGSACLGSFHHDAIRLPNGYTAVIGDVEKIFPAGTQGDTSGLPVDVIGDIVVVLNANWRVVWYFDAFEHAGGAPELDINRPAVLGETCVSGQTGCPPVLLLGTGIAPTATDWLHANSLYYNAQDGSILWSLRHQDWVVKIDYGNGQGSGNILWRLGPCGDFTFNNINNDPWPWFSHQHDAGIETNGIFTVFDNANTQASPTSGVGSSTGCMLGLGASNSRGMALSIDEDSMQVTPVFSQDLGVFSTALGSAQLLPNGDYFFLPGIVLINLNSFDSYSIEYYPTAGTTSGTQVLNLAGPEAYRTWQMPNLYTPPAT